MLKFRQAARFIINYVSYFVLRYKDFRVFHYFPFNANDRMPQGAHLTMSLCCRELEKLSLNYRLADGTILGLYRQGDFIIHDNDIDIDILDFENFDLLQARMKKIGMKLGRKVVYKKHVHQLAYYNKDHVVFDMIFWYSDKDQIINYSEEGYRRVQPKKYFLNLDIINYKGEKYPTPSRIEEWLVFRYGEEWRIPKIYKDDWKKECHDLEKL